MGEQATHENDGLWLKCAQVPQVSDTLIAEEFPKVTHTQPSDLNFDGDLSLIEERYDRRRFSLMEKSFALRRSAEC